MEGDNPDFPRKLMTEFGNLARDPLQVGIVVTGVKDAGIRSVINHALGAPFQFRRRTSLVKHSVNEVVATIAYPLGFDSRNAKKLSEFVRKPLVALHQAKVFEFVRKAARMLFRQIRETVLIPGDNFIKQTLDTGPSDRHVANGHQNALGVSPLAVPATLAHL